MVRGLIGAQRSTVGGGEREQQTLLLGIGDATQSNKLGHDKICRRVTVARRHHAQLAIVGD